MHVLGIAALADNSMHRPLALAGARRMTRNLSPRFDG
jgi:hypothetical protein